MKRLLVLGVLLLGCGEPDISCGDLFATPYAARRVNLALDTACGPAACKYAVDQAGFWAAVSLGQKRVRVAGIPDELELDDGRAESAERFELYQWVSSDRIVSYSLDSFALTVADDGSITGVEGEGSYEAAGDCTCLSSCTSHESGTFSIRSFEESPFKAPEVQLSSDVLMPGGTIVLTSPTSPFVIEAASLAKEGDPRDLLPGEKQGFDWIAFLETDDALVFGSTHMLDLTALALSDWRYSRSLRIRVPAVAAGERDGGFENASLAGYASIDMNVISRGTGLPGAGEHVVIASAGALGFPLVVPEGAPSLVLDAWAVGGTASVSVRIVGEGEPDGFSTMLEADQAIEPVELPLGEGVETVGLVSDRTEIRRDLSAWAGQTVSVVIGLHGRTSGCGASELTSGVILDEVRVEP